MRVFLSVACFVTLLCWTGCTSPLRRLTGMYVDRSAPRDTLVLFPDSTYEYQERLLTDKAGFTWGSWKLDNKRITFHAPFRPHNGFGMRVSRDSSPAGGPYPRYRLLLGDTPDPVEIEDVQVFDHNRVVQTNKVQFSGNEVQVSGGAGPGILADGKVYDSVVIFTHDFTNLLLNRPYLDPVRYTFRIYPVERFYALDRYAFIRNKKTGLLENVVDPGSKPVYMRFKKISDTYRTTW